jgi:hypothetical protein
MKDTFKEEIEKINTILLAVQYKKVVNETLKDHAIAYIKDGITILKGLS